MKNKRIRANNQVFWLKSYDSLALLKPNNYNVEVYYTKNENGNAETIYLYQGNKYIGEALLCDLSDIGKSYTAIHYAKTHKNVVYVDCSQVKSKQKLVRYIAKEFGVGGTGRYSDVYENLVFYLKTLPTPLIILDEAGDLDYTAFLEIKALWNATELACGWYMMGADGLKEKIRRAIDGKKVGYTEIFSRFGKRYGKVVPMSKEESEKMLQASAAMIIKANNSETDVNKLLRSTMGEDNVPSLRRIYKELAKIA